MQKKKCIFAKKAQPRRTGTGTSRRELSLRRMPLGAQDRALLADALGKVTGLPAAHRKRIKEALRSLPSLSALTGGIAIFVNLILFFNLINLKT